MFISFFYFTINRIISYNKNYKIFFDKNNYFFNKISKNIYKIRELNLLFVKIMIQFNLHLKLIKNIIKKYNILKIYFLYHADKNINHFRKNIKNYFTYNLNKISFYYKIKAFQYNKTIFKNISKQAIKQECIIRYFINTPYWFIFDFKKYFLKYLSLK